MYKYILILCFLVASCSKDKKLYSGEAVSIFTNKIDYKYSNIGLVNNISPTKKNIAQSFNSNMDKNFEYHTTTNLDKISIDTNNNLNLFGNYRNLSNIAIFGGNIYYLEGDKVVSLALDSLKYNWKVKLESGFFKKKFIAPKIFYINLKDDLNDIVVIATGNKIYALSAKNGIKIWNREISSVVGSNIAANEDDLFFTTIDNRLFALDIKTGTIDFIFNGVERKLSIIDRPAPIIDGKYLLLSFSSGEFYKINLSKINFKNFEEKNFIEWDYSFVTKQINNSNFNFNDIVASPIVNNGKLYLVNNSTSFAAFDYKSGQVLWQKDIRSIVNFWIYFNYIYVIDNNNILYILDKENGNIYFNIDLSKNKDFELDKDELVRDMMVVNDELLLVTQKGKLIIISLKDWKLRKYKNLNIDILSGPAVVREKIYFYGSSIFFNKLLILN